ncbi:MAG: hypothetical protein GXP28_10600 [Planctomycetes bacterium]|nr:hypothetical protein [Planctomycetota bacterium]
MPDDFPFRLRFSTRTLFRITTTLAVICGLSVVLPNAFIQITIGALWIIASGWLITGLIFAKGDTRAFCIGAAVVATSMWTGIGGGFAGGIRSLLREILFLGSVSNAETWLIHIALAAVAVANGYLCILARRYFERESSRE